MNDRDMRHSSTLFGRLMTFPAACFIGALVTDIAYAKSANMTWTTFSIWLLTAGLMVAGIAVVAGLIQAFGRRRWPTRAQTVGYVFVLILALVNAFVHSRDGYTSVVPDGLGISAITVLSLLVIAWFDRGAFARPATAFNR